MERLRYRRHFGLLACFSALIFMLGRSRFSGSLLSSFAMYGALHATALEVSRRARQTPWRSGLFILLAASLSVINLQAALWAMRLLAAVSANPGRNVLICFFAAAVALAYGLLIRRFRVRVPVTALASTAVGCACAVAIALTTAGGIPHVGPWWIAALWWWGFSCALWYVDRPP